jgi:low affinity Fe/Cu permease
MNQLFPRFVEKTAQAASSPCVFVLTLVSKTIFTALMLSLFLFYTQKPIINTDTEIVKFFIVLLIQNTENRYILIVHRKFYELVRINQACLQTTVSLRHLNNDERNDARKVFKHLQNKYSISMNKNLA